MPSGAGQDTVGAKSLLKRDSGLYRDLRRRRGRVVAELNRDAQASALVHRELPLFVKAIPAFTDPLDAYSDTSTGYAPARLGQPLMDYGFHHLAFTR